jgi:hypothetical protein
MSTSKRWTTGEKVAAGVGGGLVVLLGLAFALTRPSVREREIFLAMAVIGIHTQRPGEARPSDPALSAEAGRRLMLRFYGADIVDRWNRSGFTFWATPKVEADVYRALAKCAATTPVQLHEDVLKTVREVQAALGET